MEKKMSDETYKQPKTRKRGIKLPKEQKKKSGRKRKNDTTYSEHNKYSPDNIIKKIKVKILDYLLIFINQLLYSILDKNTIKSCLKKIKNSEYEENGKVKLIKYFDYKFFIDNTKKTSNINFLKMTLNKFLSNELSPKFKNKDKDSNKKIIEDLLSQNNEILNFIFNLSLGDWFDVFLYKKDIGDFQKMNEEQIKIIMNSFKRVDDLLISICQNFDTIYVSRFICYMYNYERWFLIKIGREKKKNNIHFNISKKKE
jgi:magnesium-transporting ATPase (P-type)